MNPRAYKDLLTELGCLADGRFVCPDAMREVMILVSLFGGGVSLMISRSGHEPTEWSYTDDFVVHQDGGGHATYYAWDGVVSVMTNPL